MALSVWSKDPHFSSVDQSIFMILWGKSSDFTLGYWPEAALAATCIICESLSERLAVSCIVGSVRCQVWTRKKNAWNKNEDISASAASVSTFFF